MTATGPLPQFRLERASEGSDLFLGRIYSPEKRRTVLVWARAPTDMPKSEVLDALEQGRAWFDARTWHLVIR